MKKVFLFFLLFAAPLAVFAHGEEEHDAFIIKMTEEGFNPSELTVTVGETVTFENDGDEDHWPASDFHPTHEQFSDFDPRRPIIPKASWSFTFDEMGTYTMHDHLYPEFTGVIIVTDDINNVDEEKPGFFKRAWNWIKSWFGGEEKPTKPENKKEQAGDGSEELTEEDRNLIKEAREEVDTDFTKPAYYDKNTLYPSYKLKCDNNNQGCISTAVKDLTREYGPVAAVELLEMMIADGRVSRSVNDHQLSHDIGRETARNYGVNSQAFLLCPMSAFNGGCQHGFFEYVLGRTETTAEAADLICQSLGDGYSNKFKFYCYHGVGHGVMMQQAYDLRSSLDTCDTFGAVYAQDGCWQGVFMENTNAILTGEAREGIFSESDPLAPCNNVADKYRHECYLNHAGYLMQFFRNNMQKGSHACLEAGDWTYSCMQSLGLMISNPSWQINLLPNARQLGEVRSAWELCKMFPESHREDCVIGGIDNIVNFDEFDVTRGDEFCNTVDYKYQRSCFTAMGRGLRNDSVDPNQAINACNRLSKEEGRTWCNRNPGLQSLF